MERIYCKQFGDFQYCQRDTLSSNWWKLRQGLQSSTVLSSNSLAEEREEGLNPSVGEPTETADLKPWEFMEDGPAVREP